MADEHVCPVCGGEVYQRNDDKPEVIETRLKAYHEQTEPLIGYYSGEDKQGLKTASRVRVINGDQKPEDVFKAILESLE